MVGRILKVSKRRRRGRELEEILQKWARTKIKANCSILEGYLRGMAEWARYEKVRCFHHE